MISKGKIIFNVAISGTVVLEESVEDTSAGGRGFRPPTFGSYRVA
jgi:hypothetical protein